MSTNLIMDLSNIDMGHRVTNHDSKCKNNHGHTYKATLSISGVINTKVGAFDEGMVGDFGRVRPACNDILQAVFDHASTYFYKDPILDALKDVTEKLNSVVYVPTAENLAHHMLLLCAGATFPYLGVPIGNYSLRLWETPNCSVSVEGEDVYDWIHSHGQGNTFSLLNVLNKDTNRWGSHPNIASLSFEAVLSAK